MDGVDTSTDRQEIPLRGCGVGTLQRSRRASPSETALRHVEKGICELVAEIPKLSEQSVDMVADGGAPPRGSAAAAASMRRRRAAGGGAAAAGGGASTMLQFYTDDATGAKMSPNTVLFMSIGFIAVVALLHVVGKLYFVRR
ncbi:hypothetical protein C4D60_Mb09t04290 [Musa balbisiana]|uniref:Protein transport protein Sec61 subunit beta n=1 Tax=Musa balbisiana TaxID=52838 RepID=A0A4V4H308_MUSBA|nr:hypothetical protein C4D60_Mb09t04290 [Musa balbisiana]